MKKKANYDLFYKIWRDKESDTKFLKTLMYGEEETKEI